MVCELGFKKNCKLARQGKGSLGRNLFVQRHRGIECLGVCQIVSHLIGAWDFGEGCGLGSQMAYLLAVHLFYLFVTFYLKQL